MANLQTTYMGLKLNNPLIASSSGMTSNVASIKKLAQYGVGAIVLKSLFEEQINLDIDQYDSSNVGNMDGMDYIQAYSKSNSLDNYLTLIKDAKQAVSIPVIASISCLTSKNWIDFATNIEKAGADAIELNLFFLPTDKNKPSASYEAVYCDILDNIKKKVSIPVAVKLGSYFTNPLGMAQQLFSHRANAAVLFNRFYNPDIDINTLTMKPGNVFSTPSDLRLSLRWISLLSAKLPQLELSASTGVHDGEALVKLLLAGATTVQVCSSLYEKGAEQVETLLRFLTEWMKKHDYQSIEEFRGAMNYKNIAHPEVYERSQFMKYYSSRE